MTTTYADAHALVTELDADYQLRHEQFRKLRLFWHGRYWDDVDSQSHGIASLFRDVTSVRSDVGPDIKLVRNLVFEVCVKYQGFLSGLPMIRTFVERPDSRSARSRADLKQRVLYATWSQVNMNQQLNKIGWFGPLMGDSFLGIWPDFDRNTVRAIVRSPEHAYPVQNFDGTKLDALLFKWKTTTGKAKRAFPGWSGPKAGSTSDATANAQIEILEYSDNDCFYRWVDKELVNGVEHNLGFNLFDQVPFIHVPGEPWNHGAVEQSVNLVEAGNALYSLVMQAMLENVFPRLILEDPMKFSETIDTGPGAVIPVNPGGKAYYLTPPTNALGEGIGVLQENERAIKQDTSMPDASFGQFDASIITGKAINALQGAGTGSLVEMVQGNGIGAALENWNEKALTIYQRMFKNEQVYLEGVQPKLMSDLNPKAFAVSFKGAQLVGSPKNVVTFSPYIDQHGKLVMGLQALGAGLVPKSYVREQIGVTDSEAMQEDIVEEVLEEAVIGAIVQALQADPTPANADTAEGQATAYLEGTAPVRAPLRQAPAALPAGQQLQPQGPGPAAGTLPGGGQVTAPPLPLPQGSVLPSQVGAPPTGAAPQTPASAPAGVTIQTALRAFTNVQLQGRAWLVGQIAAEGTAATVDVAVTDRADRQALQQAAQFPVTFHVVAGEPKEQAVEITSAQAAAA